MCSSDLNTSAFGKGVGKPPAVQLRRDWIKDRSKSHLSLDRGQKCHLGLAPCAYTKQIPQAVGDVEFFFSCLPYKGEFGCHGFIETETIGVIST